MLHFFVFGLRYSRNTVHIRNLHSSIPPKPVYKPIDTQKLPKPTKIDADTIDHLERVSLVDFANKKGIERLEQAIQLADQLSVVDTSNVEPMYSVLEDRTLQLRADVVSDGGCRKEVMANASVTEDEYFVAPPGNIPLAPRDAADYEKH